MAYKNKAQRRAWERANYAKNRDDIRRKNKEWRDANPDKTRAYAKKWNAENKGQRASLSKAWAENNPVRRKELSDKYRAKTVQKRRTRAASRCRERYWSDPAYRLGVLLRQRTQHALKGKVKVGSAVKHLGCTPAEAKAHIESLFRDGMTWENQGRWGWHVDHVRPLSSFDLTDPEQFRAASHYTNLQPLWWHENLTKHAKWEGDT